MQSVASKYCPALQAHSSPSLVHVVAVEQEASQHWVIVHGCVLHSSLDSVDLMVYPELQSATFPNSSQLFTSGMQAHSALVHSAAEQTFKGLPTVWPILQRKPSPQLIEETAQNKHENEKSNNESMRIRLVFYQLINATCS